MSLNQSFISDFSEYYRWSQRKSVGTAYVYCPGLTCMLESWQYRSFVDFQLSILHDLIWSQTFPRSPINYSDFIYLIINVHCLWKSASKIVAIINKLKYLSIHCDNLLIVELSRWLSRCRLVHDHAVFVVILRSYNYLTVTGQDVEFDCNGSWSLLFIYFVKLDPVPCMFLSVEAF